MSPLEFLEYYLPSSYFSSTYPLDILVSARRSPDQSDSHMSLQFGVRYLLIYFQHRSVSVKELQLYGPNLHKKGLSDLRQKKVNINLEFSTVQLVLVTNFSLNRQS